MKTRASTVLAAPNETGLPEIMLKQILSWPSKVHVDEVAAILFEGVYRVLDAQYGEQHMGEHMQRAVDLAKLRLSGGDGGGPTHRMREAA
jgi:hypothetical protein